MYNMEIIILLFLFINLLIKPNNYLNCGIFAWNGRYPSSFNVTNFKILGIYNDTRGGDSCGIFANGVVHKGIHLISKFKDFWKEYDFNKVKGASVVIGHARKASVGEVSHETAQPISYSFKTTKEGKRGIVLAHNGTLTNYKELAEKYKVDTEKLSSDSQILAYLLYFEGWKILKEYEGSAALLIHLLQEPDTLYVFKGASKSWASSVNLTEERPLYYYQENKNSVYISSMEDSLIMLLTDPTTESDKDKKKIKEVPDNTLLKIKNGVVTEIQKIDRSSVTKKSDFTCSSNVNYYGKRYKNYPKVNAYNEYKDAYGDLEGGYSELAFEHGVKKDDVLDPEKEILHNENFNKPNFLYYCRFRYYLNTKLADGSYFVNSVGECFTKWDDALKTNKPIGLRKLYFSRGILLTSKEAYQKVIKIIASLDKLSEFETYTTISQIQHYSVYPINIKSSYRSMIYKATSLSKSCLYDGEFQPLFHYKVYTVDQGELKKMMSRSAGSYYSETYFPDFENEMDIYADFDSMYSETDICGLGTFTFDFNDDEHKLAVWHRTKGDVPEAKVISINPKTKKTSTEADAHDQILSSKILETKNKLVASIENYQQDLLELDFSENAVATTLYSKLENFLIEINDTNFLPF